MLDNLEHLLEATPLATELLAAAPRLTILATSRTHLNLYGETEYAVPPLSAREDAVALFAERAGAAVRPRASTDRGDVAVAEICARLDGLPLAIELAAARIRTLTPTEILARLERRLELLTDGPRDVPARQRTLRDTLAVELRPAGAGGAAALRAARGVRRRVDGRRRRGGVLRDLGAAPTGCASLAANNLVLHGRALRHARDDPGARGERLAGSGEEPAIRDAHARVYLALVEEGGPNRRGDERAAWLDRVGRGAREPARRARLGRRRAETGLRLAAAMAPFWVAHGLIDEGKRSVAAVLARVREPSLGRAPALAVAGTPPPARWRARGRRARVPREPGADAAGRGVVRRRRAERARHRGPRIAASATEARRRYDEALAHAAAARPLVAGGARAREPRRALRARGPRTRRRWSVTSSAVAIAREGGDAWMLAACLTNTGRAVRQLGVLDRAGALQADALRRFVALENAWGIAACVAAIAAVAADRGDHVRAARLYGAEEAIRERARLALWPHDPRRARGRRAGDGVRARRGGVGARPCPGPQPDPGRGDRGGARVRGLAASRSHLVSSRQSPHGGGSCRLSRRMTESRSPTRPRAKVRRTCSSCTAGPARGATSTRRSSAWT